MTFAPEKGFTISNSDSKCLLENWVEERKTKMYDVGMSSKEVYKNGHNKLLSVDPVPMPHTTYRTDYIPKDTSEAQKTYVGAPCRRNFLNQMFTQNAIDQIRQEQEDEMRRQMEEKMKSETAHAFWREQQLRTNKPNTMEHDFVKEQPITFWTEHRQRITGGTKIPSGTIDSSFRKNSSFSKPISERYDEWACD